ncbi:Na+ dependent nucleoside transporter N-terminal domain-containing protein [Peribacillus muralis]|uniref:Na+ dependent nucleoside transporter N-terminal domain-containing protein n=1 Tax=Peribacillus muralis TaxID=264697 RepID=UPI0022A98F09|nr:Na+ dependent nucleoside transporter N-terminal domain-containing protein [Peribacillus muralis]
MLKLKNKLVLEFLLMNTQIGITIVCYIAKAFTNLMGMASVGVKFVFGGLGEMERKKKNAERLI